MVDPSANDTAPTREAMRRRRKQRDARRWHGKAGWQRRPRDFDCEAMDAFSPGNSDDRAGLVDTTTPRRCGGEGATGRDNELPMELREKERAWGHAFGGRQIERRRVRRDRHQQEAFLRKEESNARLQAADADAACTVDKPELPAWWYAVDSFELGLALEHGRRQMHGSEDSTPARPTRADAATPSSSAGLHFSSPSSARPDSKGHNATGCSLRYSGLLDTNASWRWERRTRRFTGRHGESMSLGSRATAMRQLGWADPGPGGGGTLAASAWLQRHDRHCQRTKEQMLQDQKRETSELILRLGGGECIGCTTCHAHLVGSRC